MHESLERILERIHDQYKVIFEMQQTNKVSDKVILQNYTNLTEELLAYLKEFEDED